MLRIPRSDGWQLSSGSAGEGRGVCPSGKAAAVALLLRCEVSSEVGKKRMRVRCALPIMDQEGWEHRWAAGSPQGC